MSDAQTRDDRPVLVTGGAGFIGCNLVDRLCRDGHRVIVFDNLARPRVETNLEWLRRTHGTRIETRVADIRDATAVRSAAVEAKAVFHLAAQVAVTTSLVEPLADFSINVEGTIHLLEALRQHNAEAPLVFASTNKVYGNLAAIPLLHDDDAHVPADDTLRRRGIAESVGLAFHTPYGCSKGAADQYVLDYATSFGLRTAVMRMSCIYGPHQMGTEDQGWVAHFIRRALAGETITVFGDGHQVRDILHVDDAVAAYCAAWAAIDRARGRAFNLGGGPANAVSLVQLLRYLEEVIARPLDIMFEDWRAGDQRYYVSDRGAVDEALHLPAPRPWRDGVRDLVRWFESQPRPSDAEVTRTMPAEAL